MSKYMAVCCKSIIRGNDHMASIHRAGCGAAKKEAEHSSGDVVELKAENIIDAQKETWTLSGLEECEWPLESVHIHNCCKTA